MMIRKGETMEPKNLCAYHYHENRADERPVPAVFVATRHECDACMEADADDPTPTGDGLDIGATCDGL